ncbi:unnamed protein product [Boreogadus saida]
MSYIFSFLFLLRVSKSLLLGPARRAVLLRPPPPPPSSSSSSSVLLLVRCGRHAARDAPSSCFLQRSLKVNLSGGGGELQHQSSASRAPRRHTLSLTHTHWNTLSRSLSSPSS